jgi:hypothetical protein
MPHQRKTIPIATSALLFVCLMLHAQAGLSAQAFAPYNDVEAYNAYQSLISDGWTVTAAQARRLVIQAQTSGYPISVRGYIVLSPIAFSADKTITAACLSQSGNKLCSQATFHVLEKKDGVWKNMRWMGTSRAWAS